MSGVSPKVLKDFILSAEKETTFGTPVDSTSIALPTDDMQFDPQFSNHQIARARGVRGDHEGDAFNDSDLSIPTASFTAPVTSNQFVVLLPGVLQSASAWSPTTNVYDMFTVAGSESLPTPKADNSGYFYTLFRNSSDATLDDERLTSAIPTSLKLSLDPNENDGLLTAQWDFIAKAYSRGITGSGTVTQESLASTLIYKYSGLTTISAWGQSPALKDIAGFEINVTNNGKFLLNNPNSEVVFPMFDVSGTLKLVGGAAAEAIKALCASSAVSTGADLSFTWGDGTVSSAGEMILTVFGLPLSYTMDYSDGEICSIAFKGMFGGESEYPFEANFFAA